MNLIHFLDFYFAFMFVAGTYRRLAQYANVASLIVAGPGRWPRLLKLVSQHRMIFWTWKTLAPMGLWLALWCSQVFASRVVFPEAGSVEDGLTTDRLLEHWPALFAVIPFGLAMLAWDVYSLFRVGQLDRLELELHLDQAEYWLRSRTAHVVRFATFGYINPRRMVAEEVQKALVAVSDMLNFTLWWIVLQVGLRLGFGLSLWITWAITHTGPRMAL